VQNLKRYKKIDKKVVKKLSKSCKKVSKLKSTDKFLKAGNSETVRRRRRRSLVKSTGI
jgi:hypothetical protein